MLIVIYLLGRNVIKTGFNEKQSAIRRFTYSGFTLGL
jgi:hypothetical protein